MHTVISADGTAIAYETAGAGSPVILVGGAFNDRQAAAPLASVLAPHCTVVSYDRRGRGSSGDTVPYAVEREVEDLASILAAVGGSASMFGVSSGAALAFEAAAAGLAIGRLAMFEPPYRVDGSPPLPEDFMARIAELTSSGRNGEAVEYFLTKAVGLPGQAVAQMRGAPRRPASMWPALEAMAPTLVYDNLILGDGSLPAERLAAVTVPTLVIDSTASPDWLRQAAKAVAGALADAQHRSLDGGFHDVPPQVLGPVLQAFLAG
jgi:pimeloyl-ACP methyl ester carboxylesterase